jgi:hypothetical protein
VVFGTMYGPVRRLPSPNGEAIRGQPAQPRATTRYPAVVGTPNYDLDRERQLVWRSLLLVLATFTLIIVARLIYSAW